MAQTLAQMVRAKYPGAYDDLSDTALEAKVEAKYPGAYADIPRSTAAPAEAAKPRWSGQTYVDAAKLVGNKAVEYAPEIGGAVGGLAVGLGAGLPSLGLGAVPGAIAGATVGGAAGQALKGAVQGTAAPTMAGRAAQIGTAGAGQGGAEAVGAGLGAIASKVAPKLMQSALKPTLSVLKEYRTTPARLVKTLLDEGVNVSEGGLQRLNDLLTAKNVEIADAVKNAPGLIGKDSILSRLGQTYERFSKGLDARGAMKAISEEGGKLIDHPEYVGDALTVPQAQGLKQAIYAEASDAYGQLSRPALEAKKSIARGLKEEIETAAPGIKGLNAREAEFMAARDAVERRVTVAGNRDPVGFAWVAAHPTTFLAALIDRAPVVKSMLSHLMYDSAAKISKVSPQLIRLAVHSLASSGAETPPTDGGPAPQ